MWLCNRFFLESFKAPWLPSHMESETWELGCADSGWLSEDDVSFNFASDSPELNIISELNDVSLIWVGFFKCWVLRFPFILLYFLLFQPIMVSKYLVSLETVISGRLFPPRADVSSFLPSTSIAMAVAARSTDLLSTAERRDSAHSLHRPKGSVLQICVHHGFYPFQQLRRIFILSSSLSHFGFRVVLWFHKELSKHLLSNNRWGGFQTKTKRAEDFRVRISAKNTNIEKETKFQLDGSNKCVTWGTEAGSISPFPSTQKQQIAGFQHFWSENSYVGRWSDWGSRIFPTGVVLKTSTANKKPPNLLDADRSGHFVMGWNPCISWSVVYLATSLFETLLIDTSQVLQDWNADDTTPKKIGEKK